MFGPGRRAGRRAGRRSARRVMRRQDMMENMAAPPPQETYAPPPQPAPQPVAPPGDDYAAELQKLASLREQGIITDEEFEAKKKQILGI